MQEQVPIDFGFEPRIQVEASVSATGAPSLRVTSVLMPSCPVHVTQDFTWNGNVFTLSPLQYEVVPDESYLAYCELVIDEATNGWGPEASIAVIKPLLDTWPPEQDTNGRPYPPDAPDQLRYRLGVLYALADQSADATSTLSELIDTPTVPDSSWVAPAELFLRAYQQPQDLYTACQQAQICNLRDAMASMINYSATNDPSLALDYLQKHGIKSMSSGYFDFDKDGQQERWMVIQPKPAEKLEFWILSQQVSNVQPIFVEIFEAGQSFPFYHSPEGTVPVIQFELHKGFIFRRLKDSRQAYIQWVEVDYARSAEILDGYNQAVAALMDREDPKVVLGSLLKLFTSPRFIGDCIAYRICDRFHYTLALTYNLTGDETNAIDEYLWVWRNYGTSPYATLARLKLDYFPLPTFTPITTPTKTRTPTRTPGPGTVYPTLTPTRTSEAYP